MCVTVKMFSGVNLDQATESNSFTVYNKVHTTFLYVHVCMYVCCPMILRKENGCLVTNGTALMPCVAT